ncbi:hypothetical protein EYZ11_009378 [Aspergillus tanneri]|uniref:Uncharacterized protein n=1 Tax=Aspergillus tanneri TaxID=1220188 RepID=A0A4S3J8H4_9EURO|nr:hypothetical protein EYZ11_009378 [Aspergillus tanneri]
MASWKGRRRTPVSSDEKYFRQPWSLGLSIVWSSAPRDPDCRFDPGKLEVAMAMGRLLANLVRSRDLGGPRQRDHGQITNLHVKKPHLQVFKREMEPLNAVSE